MSDQQQLWDAGRVVIKGRRGRKITCTCGTCRKCKRRDYARDYNLNYYYGLTRPKPRVTEHKPRRGKEGYLEIWVAPDDPLAEMRNRRGLILHHRYVMAQHLGRVLQPNEDVHHKNGDRADNRLDNLELWTIDHPRGQRVEDKLEWAIRFVHRHSPDRLANPHG